MKVRWIVGGLAVVALCIGVLVCVAFAQVIQEQREELALSRVEATLTVAAPTPEEEPTVTRAVATATSAPSATAEPTETEVPATATAIPATATFEPTEAPTATRAPTETPEPTATVVIVARYDSGGLGLDRAQWEENHVLTGDAIVGDAYDGGATNGGYDVWFQEERVWTIWQQFRTPISASDALFIGELLLPNDAVFVEEYSPSGFPETTVRVYFSESFMDRFDAEAYVYGVPGELQLRWNEYSQGVESLIVGGGNDPR